MEGKYKEEVEGEGGRGSIKRRWRGKEGGEV